MVTEPINDERNGALDVLLDFRRTPTEKLEAAQVLSRFMPYSERAVFAASMTAMETMARDEGYLLGLKQGRREAPYNYVENMTTKNQSDNHGSAIAMGDHASAGSNTGQQQGVNVGSGSATVASSSMAAPTPADTFDAVAFRAEVTDVLYLMAERIEHLEAEQISLVTQAMGSLKRADYSNATTTDDAYQMIEDMWGETMRLKYSPLCELFSSEGAMKGVAEIAPVLLSLLSKLIGT